MSLIEFSNTAVKPTADVHVRLEAFTAAINEIIILSDQPCQSRAVVHFPSSYVPIIRKWCNAVFPKVWYTIGFQGIYGRKEII
jgi:hypothetical protein